ncbi:YhaN family protein [Komagataeibacter xylinus]|uniref:AAA family ATPase n=1 Tax=Komagataeibacter xylinus TaxID=28448 RepID=A0A857FQM9_KOMXY|nr:YhaN family protein [Komagataeibacter xylinus]QHC36671.1 AAA family ATPase [Komagataeibacter xylinus]
MHIRNLRIIRYGAIENLELDFGAVPGLHVIHGPNEAGKSTTLSAMTDFLFGIPNQSDAGAVFGNDRIRLEACLMLANGTMLELSRRKGRTRTLASLDGQPVSDDVLAPALGGMTRERFTALFGLNDATLRSGGAALLKANGDIGRLIVEAGGGLRALMTRLAEIDEKRAALFAPRRAAERAFYKAADAFRAAQDRLKEASLTHEAYTSHCQQRDAARQQRADFDREQAELRRLHARLEQLVKALPQLHALTLLEAERATLADLDPLPTGMGAQITAALDVSAAAQASHAAACTQAERLQRQTAVPPEQAQLIAQGARVEHVIALGEVVRRNRAARPEREAKRQQINLSLASLRQWLNKGPDADLRQFMPERVVLEEIRQMADAQMQWRNTATALEQRIAETDLALARKATRLDTLRGQGHDRPVDADATAFAALPAEIRRLELRRDSLAAIQERLDARLRTLGVGSVAALQALPCPDAQAVREAGAEQQRLHIHNERITQALTTERERLATLRPELARLEQTGNTITPEMLHAARAQRDSAWHAIRDGYLGADTTTPSATRQHNVTMLESAITQADSLSRQLLAQADRLARIEALRHDIAQCSDRIACHERNLDDTARQIARHWQAFITPFSVIMAHAATPAALEAFVQQRGDALAEAEQVATEHAALEHEHIRVAVQRDGLAHLARMLGVDPDLPPAACVEAVTRALRLHASAHEEYDRLRREHDDLMPQRAQLARQAAALEAERQQWAARWAPAMQAIGLNADALPMTGRNLADEWAAAPAAIIQLTELDEATAQAAAHEAELAHDLDGLRPHLALSLPTDAALAAHELEQHWREAQKARHQREALQPERDKANNMVVQGEADVQAAASVLEALQARTHAQGNDALRQLATRLAQRDKVAEAHAQALHTLSCMTDGQSPAGLHAALEGRDGPELQAEIAALQARQEQLAAARDDAVRTEQHAESALAAFEHNTVAPQAAARREAAITSLHRIVEEYAELTLARNLIAAAMDRVRAQVQDPLVRQAGTFMAQATGGAFGGIQTELDASNEPVVRGVRPDGSTVAVSEMSAGTRDQLFLAFRLASVETYCRTTEPLPFIADDLLVQFDDARSHSTLNVLAEFARTTQVLLFTHHDSIRDMARAMQAEGAAINLLELPALASTRPVAAIQD